MFNWIFERKNVKFINDFNIFNSFNFFAKLFCIKNLILEINIDELYLDRYVFLVIVICFVKQVA